MAFKGKISEVFELHWNVGETIAYATRDGELDKSFTEEWVCLTLPQHPDIEVYLDKKSKCLALCANTAGVFDGYSDDIPITYELYYQVFGFLFADDSQGVLAWLCYSQKQSPKDPHILGDLWDYKEGKLYYHGEDSDLLPDGVVRTRAKGE